MTTSLRERKKAQTHEAIYRAAAELFKNYGYAETTLADIAESANVSQRTIFSYYPSKEAILFSHSQAFIDSFTSHIENRGAQTVLDAIRTFTHPSTVPHSNYRDIRELVNNNPPLQDYLSSLLAKLEEKIVVHIAEEYHFSVSSIQAHMVAASIRAIISYRLQYGKNSTSALVALRYIEGGLRESTHA